MDSTQIVWFKVIFGIDGINQNPSIAA